jgi:hypothetical protein
LLGSEGEVEVVLENEVLHTSIDAPYLFSIEWGAGTDPTAGKALL